MSDTNPIPVTREELARTFHESYERLAPSHGYSTRVDSAVPWDDVRDPNRSLMLETMDAILTVFTVLHPAPTPVTPRDPTPWTCSHCGSTRWVGWAAGPGWPRKAQCVPCGMLGDLPAEPRRPTREGDER